MNDIADMSQINTHAKGDSSDRDLDLIVGPVLLHLSPLRILKTSMIWFGSDLGLMRYRLGQQGRIRTFVDIDNATTSHIVLFGLCMSFGNEFAKISYGTSWIGCI
jgi:hypothetical protein